MDSLKSGEVVLDIGSGVDMTPAMLERARAAAERNHIANVEFAEELPVADGQMGKWMWM